MNKRAAVLALSTSLLWLAGCTEALPQAAEPVLAGSVPVSQVDHSPSGQIYRLHLHHLHTGEWIDVAYRQGHLYLTDNISLLDHFLRDYRTDDDAHYPVREFDLLNALMQRLGKPNGVIEMVCGYRTPWSNHFLQSLSRNSGVAEHSEHMLSQAIDIRVPGVSTEGLRDAALSLQMGGVGYYPSSGFVHVDVGPVRQWSFGTSHHILSAGSSPGHHQHHRAV